MLFKNLMVFTIDPGVDLEIDSFDQQLAKNSFKPCGPQQLSSMGWVSPLGPDAEGLTHEGTGYVFLMARKEDRLLPATVVRDAVSEEVATIEAAQERKISRKERMEIREDLAFEMTPRAFRRSSYIQGLILPDAGCIIVDAPNWKRAEDWISLLRESLGTLPVRPADTTRSVSMVMTAWLSGKSGVPKSVDFADECELQLPQENGAVLRCRHQELTSEEIKSHLDAGKLVTMLAIDWSQSLSFLLTDALEIKRLRFSDGLMQQAKEDGAADEMAELDAVATLMALEFGRFLPSLWALFGGLSTTGDA